MESLIPEQDDNDFIEDVINDFALIEEEEKELEAEEQKAEQGDES